MQAPQHLGKAVLLMVSKNIGSITMLHALAGGVLQIMFTLSFLFDNKVRFESFIRRVLHPGYKNYIASIEPPVFMTDIVSYGVPILDLVHCEFFTLGSEERLIPCCELGIMVLG